MKLDTVSTIFATMPLFSPFFVFDFLADDRAFLLLLPAAERADELLVFVEAPLRDFELAVLFPPLRELADFEADLELPPRVVFEVDFDDPDREVPDERDDLDPDEDDFDLDEPAFVDLEDDPEPLEVRELLPDLDELPDFEAEPFVDVERPDLEVEPFDPPEERLDVDRLELDLLAPVELFELEDLPEEPDLELLDFLVVDFDPEDFDDDEEEDFDPEDFLEDEDFDPEDFLVAAMTLIPRYGFRNKLRPFFLVKSQPVVNYRSDTFKQFVFVHTAFR